MESLAILAAVVFWVPVITIILVVVFILKKRFKK